MVSNFFLKNKLIFLNLLILISISSFINTISKGLVNGCDFQWQPSVLFWEGVNHYQKFILNGKGDFLCQNGEYAHILQVILYPFSILEWEKARIMWLVTNTLFAFLIPIMTCKYLKLSNYKSILLILIFITCYPTRMNLNYGQQSLFVMFFMMLPFIKNSKVANFFSGFSYVKYSSGYVIFLNFIANKEYKNLLISIIPYMVGWFIYFFFTNTDPLINFFEPIQLSLQKGYIRDADFYSLINIYLLSEKTLIIKLFFIFLIFGMNLIALLKINKNKDTFFKMSLILICPLIFFPHSNYDYILLFPLLCYSFLNNEYLINKINIYYVIYIFYFNRIVKNLIEFDVLYQPMLLVSLVMIVCLNLYSHKFKKNLYLFNIKII